jgi:hypothetical protein
MIGRFKVYLDVLAYIQKAIPPDSIGDKLFQLGVAAHHWCRGFMTRVQNVSHCVRSGQNCIHTQGFASFVHIFNWMDTYLVSLLYLDCVKDPKRGVNYIWGYRLALICCHHSAGDALNMLGNKRYWLVVPMFGNECVLEFHSITLRHNLVVWRYRARWRIILLLLTF